MQAASLPERCDQRVSLLQSTHSLVLSFQTFNDGKFALLCSDMYTVSFLSQMFRTVYIDPEQNLFSVSFC